MYLSATECLSMLMTLHKCSSSYYYYFSKRENSALRYVNDAGVIAITNNWWRTFQRSQTFLNCLPCANMARNPRELCSSVLWLCHYSEAAWAHARVRYDPLRTSVATVTLFSDIVDHKGWSIPGLAGGRSLHASLAPLSTSLGKDEGWNRWVWCASCLGGWLLTWVIWRLPWKRREIYSRWGDNCPNSLSNEPPLGACVAGRFVAPPHEWSMPHAPTRLTPAGTTAPHRTDAWRGVCGCAREDDVTWVPREFHRPLPNVVHSCGLQWILHR